METQLLVYDAPMLVGLVFLAVLTDCERLGGRISVPSVSMDAHLVNGVGLCRPTNSHNHAFISTNVLINNEVLKCFETNFQDFMNFSTLR